MSHSQGSHRNQAYIIIRTWNNQAKLRQACVTIGSTYENDSACPRPAVLMIHINAQTSASGFVEENGVVPGVSLDEGAIHSSTALFQLITRRAVDMHPESGGECPNSEFEMGLQGRMSEFGTSKKYFVQVVLPKTSKGKKKESCVSAFPNASTIQQLSSIPSKAIYLCCCWRSDLWALASAVLKLIFCSSHAWSREIPIEVLVS